MTIGIYGGTFDPVHNGHLVIATAMMERIPLEKLVVMPAYIPPHKRGKVRAGFDLRLDWLRRAFSGIEGVEISDFEGRSKTVSYTFETIEHFEKDFGRVAYIIGEDSFVNIESWYRYRELIERVDLYVYPRYCAGPRDDGVAERLKGFSGNIRMMDELPIVQFSSTTIRERCEASLSVRGYVPGCLEDEIFGFYSKA